MKNKLNKLKRFTVEYSVLKNNKIVKGSIVINSVGYSDETVKLAKLDISTKERVFIQNIKSLKFK